MGWANHARCLHCGVNLPLYRKITDGEFCSTAHRKAFQEDQSRLAIQRLMETQQMCNRVTEAVRVEHRVEQFVQSAPPQPGHLDLEAVQPVQLAPGFISADPLTYEFGGRPAIAALLRGKGVTGALPFAAGVRLKVLVTAAPPERPAASCEPIISRRPGNIPGTLPNAALRPIFESHVTVESDLKPLGRFAVVENGADLLRTPRAIASKPSTWLPLKSNQTIRGSSLLEPGLAGPRRHGLTVRACEPGLSIGEPRGAETFVGSTMLPRVPACGGPRLVPPVVNRLVRLRPPVATAAPSSHSLPEARAAAASAAVQAMLPVFVLGTGAREWRPGADTRLAALPRPRAVEPPPTWGLKGVDWCALPYSQRVSAFPEFEAAGSGPQPQPGMAGRLPVPLYTAREMKAGAGGILPAETFLRPAVYPSSRFVQDRVLDARLVDPVRRSAGEGVPSSEPEAAAAKPAAPPVRPAPTRQQYGFNPIAWLRTAPASLRVVAMAIPLLLFFALRPSPNKAEAGTRANRGNVKSFVNARLTAVRSAIQNRAGIELLDDFRTGLDNWESGGDLTQAWSYDQTGFVRPGPLALYRPSMGMSEYDFEFLGQMDTRSLSWVYRAEDLRNYHAAKLVMLKGGPLPTIGLDRFTVINGKEGPHKLVTLPLTVQQDTVYRVRMEVRGPDFSLYVQNQMVQFWTDTRLEAGGVGFFSSRGERSRVRWMQISHQYDTIGRLCAYFSPMAVVTYNMQPTMGAGTK